MVNGQFNETKNCDLVKNWGFFKISFRKIFKKNLKNQVFFFYCSGLFLKKNYFFIIFLFRVYYYK